jgi:hypothetical protein
MVCILIYRSYYNRQFEISFFSFERPLNELSNDIKNFGKNQGKHAKKFIQKCTISPHNFGKIDHADLFIILYLFNHRLLFENLKA